MAEFIAVLIGIILISYEIWSKIFKGPLFIKRRESPNMTFVDMLLIFLLFFSWSENAWRHLSLHVFFFFFFFFYATHFFHVS